MIVEEECSERSGATGCRVPEATGIRLKLVEPGGSRTNFGGNSLTRTTHPAYREWVDGFTALAEKMEARLPGPEKVVAMIYRAATDSSRRLRFPVITAGYPLVYCLLRDWGWNAMMRMMAQRAKKLSTP